MAKKISSRDIFAEVDIFKGIRDSADDTIKKMELLQIEVQETATALKKSIGGAKFDSSKAIKNVVKATSDANKLAKESVQIDKAKSQATITRTKALAELEKLEQQKTKTESTQIRLAEQKAKQNERLNKQAERSKKLAKDEASAYKKLEKNTRDLKNQSKELGAQLLVLEQSGKKNTAQYRKLEQQYRKVTNSAKSGDKQLKKLDKTVGDNFRNVGNYKDAIRGLVGVLGTLGAGVGIGQIFRSVTGTLIEFDQAQADLTAISGKTRDELSGLTQQAKDLGATSQFTATEITGLQIELAKLGFTTKEIENSTEAVSNFASATGADLASASKVAGSALRAFRLDASEMDRVVSTLGVATTKSALSFASYETSLSTVAPVASAFNFSVEDTTALLGQLANSGFDASSSATATRNIILNLADSTGDLAQELGRPINSLDDLAEGLKELDDKGIDLAKSLELTDKRSVAAFNTFLKGSGDLIEFRDSITDVNDELEEMAKKRLDSVQGQLTLLNSAWEGFLLDMGDATGASNTLKSAIGFLAENLNTILNVIGKLIRGFLLYKGTLMGLKAIQFAITGGFKELGALILKQIPLTRQYAQAQKEAGVATKNAGTAVKGFGKAFASIGIFLIITAITELAMAWYDVASGAKEAREEQERQDRAQQTIDNRRALGEKLASDRAKKLNDEREREFQLIDRNIRKQKLAIDQSLTANKIKKKTAELDKSAIAQKKVVLFLQTQEIGAESIKLQEAIDEARQRVKDEQTRTKVVRKATKITQGGVPYAFVDATVSDVDSDRVAFARGKVEELEAQLVSLNEMLALTNDEYEDIDLSLKEFEQRQKKSNKVKDKATTTTRKLNEALKEQNRYLSQQKKLQQDLLIIQQDKQLAEIDNQFDEELTAQLRNTAETGAFDATQLNALIDLRVRKETEFLKQREGMQIEFLKDQYAREKQARLDALTDERDALLAQDNITQPVRDKINEDYDNKLDDLNDDEVLRKKDLGKKIEIIEANTQKSITEIQKQGMESRAGIEEQGKDAEEQARQKELTDLQDHYKSVNEIVKLSADYFVKQSARKVEALNQEIQDAQKQADTFRQLAENGNIDAKESLAEQQRIIDEANKKKLQEQKRQERIRLAESVFQTYTSKLESDSKNPLAETIRDTTLLMQFINSIPAFESGIEDTGSNGKGVDGRGGFHAILHPNERVVPKSLNEKIGALTNEQLTQLAVDYQNGQIVNGSQASGNALNFAVLVNGINELKDVIKNKPETNIEMGEITGSLMEIVKTTKQGNSTTFNRFKIKK